MLRVWEEKHVAEVLVKILGVRLRSNKTLVVILYFVHKAWVTLV